MWLTLLLIALFGPPVPPPSLIPTRIEIPTGSEPHCQWMTKEGCRDEDMEILGTWDPRKPVGEWDSNSWTKRPEEYGAFSLEHPSVSATFP